VEASILLKEASENVDNLSLKKFLSERADAFLSNDYRQSEISWIDVDAGATLEVTVGPYEKNEDNLYGAKTSFCIFVVVIDAQESHEIQDFLTYYQEINANLPMNSTFKTGSVPAVGQLFAGSLVLQGGFAAQTIQVRKRF
jgi:hypothetical protein